MTANSESKDLTLYQYSLSDANNHIRTLSIGLLIGSEDGVGWSLFMRTITEALPVLKKLPLVFVMYVIKYVFVCIENK